MSKIVGKSKESFNEGMKVEYKRSFRSYTFLSPEKTIRKQTGSAGNFTQPLLLACFRCLNLQFNNQTPPSAVPLLPKNIENLNLQMRITQT